MLRGPRRESSSDGLRTGRTGVPRRGRPIDESGRPTGRLLFVAALALALAGCGDDGGEAKRPPPPPPAYLLDAAPPPSQVPPLPTTIPRYDPASGYHLDDDSGAAAARRPDRVGPRDRRTLALMLKSSPSGAIAAVDGKVVGRTPVYWEGEFNGRERDFTFVLPGYSMARYRFVPTRDGFVHGRLAKVSDEGDGGVPPIPAPGALRAVQDAAAPPDAAPRRPPAPVPIDAGPAPDAAVAPPADAQGESDIRPTRPD